MDCCDPAVTRSWRLFRKRFVHIQENCSDFSPRLYYFEIHRTCYEHRRRAQNARNVRHVCTHCMCTVSHTLYALYRTHCTHCMYTLYALYVRTVCTCVSVHKMAISRQSVLCNIDLWTLHSNYRTICVM